MPRCGGSRGPDGPSWAEQDRALIVAALECVDHVLVFDELEPTSILRLLRPEVHCKGADYAPPDGKPIPELAVVEAYGGRVAFLPLLEGISTTDLICRLHSAEPRTNGDAHGLPDGRSRQGRS